MRPDAKKKKRTQTGIILAMAAGLAAVASPLANAAPEFGDAMGEPFVVRQAAEEGVLFEHPGVMALDADGDAFLAWITRHELDGRQGVYVRRVAADGRLGDVVTLAESATATPWFHTPVIAVDADGDAVVAWVQTDDLGANKVWFQRIAADGTSAGEAIELGTANVGADAGNPAVAMDAAGNFVIGWENEVKVEDGGVTTYLDTVRFRRFDANGNPQGAEQQVGGDDNASAIDLALNAGGDVGVNWMQGGVLYGQTFAADGSALAAAPFVISEATIIMPQAVAIDADGDLAAAFLAVHVSPDYTFTEELRVARFAATGETVTDKLIPENGLDAAQREIFDIAFDAGGRVIVGWQALLMEIDPDTAAPTRLETETTVFRLGTESETENVPLQQSTCTADGGEICRMPFALAFDADADMLLVYAEGKVLETLVPTLAQRVHGPESADLAVTLELPAEDVAPGDTVAATLIVENLHVLGESGIAAYDGALGATRGIAADITLPAAFDPDAKTGEWICESTDETTIRCVHPGVLSAASEVVLETSFVVPADAGEGEYAFSASVSGDRVDPVAGNNTSKASVSVAVAAPPASDNDNPTPATGGGGGALGWLMLLFAPLGSFGRKRSR